VAAWLDPTRMGAVEWIAVDPPWQAAVDPVAHEAAGAGGAGGPPTPTPFARLRALIAQERHDMGVVVVYALGVGLLTLAIPIAVQSLVNTVAFGTLLQPLVILTVLLFGALSFAATLRALQTWVVEIMERRIFLRYVSTVAERLPRVRLSVFDREHGPALVNRYFDIFTVQKATAALLVGGLEIVLTTTVGLIVLAAYHPLLFVFSLLFVLTIFVTLVGLGRSAVTTAVAQSKAKYKVADWLEEIARLPLAFKLGGGPELARLEAERLANRYLRARAAHFRIAYRQTLSALALMVVASAGILGIGGWLVMERELTLGQLVAAELIVTAVVVSYAKVGKKLRTAYDLLAALDKVGQLIDLPLDPPAAPVAPPPAPAGSAVSVEHVAFGFEGAAPIFEDLSFEVKPGERVAITGTRGAGRSTLADLVAGLRTPTRGALLIDGVEAREAARCEDRVVLVRGEGILAATVADNVAFGHAHVDARQVREALRRVDLLDEIARLPEGLATVLNPSGAPLSHGQAVRLAIARALAARPSLLIIDDLLDGVDRTTREAVLAALGEGQMHCTVLLVTGDPALAARCERTLALEGGVLREEASHG
jgi:putative ABC transport system ATP-binding protein